MHGGDRMRNDVVHRVASQLGVGRWQHPVGEHRNSERSDIVGTDIVAT
jgi:hypothetical protein